MNEKPLFMKIEYRDGTPHLLGRTREDISAENYGSAAYKRPLVMFQSVQDSIEKSLWHYERNILPLIAEDNLELTCMAAAAFRIDAIVGDAASLSRLSGVLNAYLDTRRIRQSTVIDVEISRPFLATLKKEFPQATCIAILKPLP